MAARLQSFQVYYDTAYAEHLREHSKQKVPAKPTMKEIVVSEQGVSRKSYHDLLGRFMK